MTISAIMIADSISQQGIRICTLQLRYPKFIHGEFMTHRVFSRNASSSRAIPVERLIKDVIEDPVYPQHWGKNQPGMQADEECNNELSFSEISNDGVGICNSTFQMTREEGWDLARDRAITLAEAFAKAGYHKQIVNRLLEPFCHINVVVTSTEWSNFFALRRHKDAQPEMRLLADAIFTIMSRSNPRHLNPGEWHLPYVGPGDFTNTPASAVKDHWLIQVSVARCARVSYLTQEGKTPDPIADLRLYERLVGSVPLHASPAEHQATPDELTDATWRSPHLHGNFTGWVQYRKTLRGENQ